MANPEYTEKLDILDKLSVCLYRIGISLFALSMLIFAIMLVGFNNQLVEYYHAILLLVGVASALSAGNIHVYNKYVRAVINWSAWIGILLMLSDPERVWVWLSLGFLFITFSGIALKESFCFKVMGLKLVPVLLILTVYAIWAAQPLLASFVMAISGLVMGYLSIVKWRMPLHFDIGIKANYEI